MFCAMGRGLSDLQQKILVVAWRERKRRNTARAKRESTKRWEEVRAACATVGIRTATAEPDRVDAYNAQLLAGCFGFGTGQPKDYSRPGNHFSISEVGAARYRSAMSSLSRATWRLQQRGLVQGFTGVYRWSGIALTDAGATAAKQIASK